MSERSVRVGVVTASGRQCLRIAVAALLVTPGVAGAQTVPYQSSQRQGIGGGLGQTEMPQGGRFEPRVEAAVQYASNMNLAEDDEPQVDAAGLELAPGFYASVATPRVKAGVDYSLIGRAWEDSDANDVSHRLAANGQWLAIPEWFALRGQASYGDGIIDPAEGINYGGLGIFGVSNMQEVATATLNPVLQHRFDSLEFSADYRYGRTWYLDQGKGQDPVSSAFSRDSTDESAHVSIGTAADAFRFFATAFYSWEQSDTDDLLLPYEFERAGIDAGMPLIRAFSLVGGWGVETDLSKRAARGGLDAEFWNVGLRWTPNDHTEAEIRYGDQSYGESYSFSASHRARLLEFRGSYSEQPTVHTQRLSLADIFPGELPPGVPDVDLGIVNNLPYISRTAQLGIDAVGARTRVGVSGFWYERDYLAGENTDETGYGAGINATRDFASNLSGDLDLSYNQYERTTGIETFSVAENRDTQLTLRLNRQSSQVLTLSGEVGYLVRTGESDYDGWWVALRARYTP